MSPRPATRRRNDLILITNKNINSLCSSEGQSVAFPQDIRRLPLLSETLPNWWRRGRCIGRYRLCQGGIWWDSRGWSSWHFPLLPVLLPTPRWFYLHINSSLHARGWLVYDPNPYGMVARSGRLTRGHAYSSGFLSIFWRGIWRHRSREADANQRLLHKDRAYYHWDRKVLDGYNYGCVLDSVGIDWFNLVISLVYVVIGREWIVMKHI